MRFCVCVLARARPLQHGIGAAVAEGIIFWILVFMLLWAYFKVVFTDPGSVPDDYVQVMSGAAENANQPNSATNGNDAEEQKEQERAGSQDELPNQLVSSNRQVTD